MFLCMVFKLGVENPLTQFVVSAYQKYKKGNKIMFKTYMWREAPGIPKDKVYRFQTSDPNINRRMRRRKDFKLTCYGMNKKFWIYQTKKYSLKDAKKTLQRVTRQNIDFDAVNDVFCTNNGVIMTPKYTLKVA